MAEDIFSFACSALPPDGALVGWKGAEGLSRPYRYEIFVSTPPPEDLEDAIGASATLAVRFQPAAPPYEVHGVVTGADVIHEVPGRAMLRLVVEPRLACLALTLHSRIFTNQSIPDPTGRCSRTPASRGTRTAPAHRDVRGRGARLPVPRERLRLRLAAGWSARASTTSSSRATRGRSSSSPTTGPARRAAPAARALLRVSGADRSAGERLQTSARSPARAPLPAASGSGTTTTPSPQLDVSGTAPRRRTGVGEISVYGARFFTPGATASASPSSAPRSCSPGRGRLHGDRHGALPPPGLHLRAPGPPAREPSTRGTS